MPQYLHSLAFVAGGCTSHNPKNHSFFLLEMRYQVSGSPSQVYDEAPDLLNEQSKALSACGMNVFGHIGHCTTLVVRVSYFGNDLLLPI